MQFPWKRRTEEAHQEVLADKAEREQETVPLTRRAERVIREAVRHRDDDFTTALEELMRRRPT